MEKRQTKKWGVYYIGAPHGINEIGELISWHKTEENAEKAMRKLQRQSKYYGSNTKIKEIVIENNQGGKFRSFTDVSGFQEWLEWTDDRDNKFRAEHKGNNIYSIYGKKDGIYIYIRTEKVSKRPNARNLKEFHDEIFNSETN